MIDQLLPQTPDPDNGKIAERKFVPSNEVTSWVKWGVTGDALFKDAIILARNKFFHEISD